MSVRLYGSKRNLPQVITCMITKSEEGCVRNVRLKSIYCYSLCLVVRGGWMED